MRIGLVNGAACAVIALLLPCGCVSVPAEVEAEFAPPDGRRPNNYALHDAAPAQLETPGAARPGGAATAPPASEAGEDDGSGAAAERRR